MAAGPGAVGPGVSPRGQALLGDEGGKAAIEHRPDVGPPDRLPLSAPLVGNGPPRIGEVTKAPILGQVVRQSRLDVAVVIDVIDHPRRPRR